jgi:ketosteroid isomerase-like protein
VAQDPADLVRALQPPPDQDLGEVFGRDASEEEVEQRIAAMAPFFTEDFLCVFHQLSSVERPGIRGLRGAWLDWIEPWERYRAEIQEVVPAGDRVLVLSRDLGLRRGMTEEVELTASAVWTVREGRVARAEFFTHRADAYAAAGLQPEASEATGRRESRPGGTP